ncbi:MAG: hypothetical protein AAF597_11895, partial [Bacteroidota bacterium]
NELSYIDITDLGKGNFHFRLARPFFSESALEAVVAELDKGYYVIEATSNKHLYEFKVLELDHPTNFSERHNRFGEIEVFGVQVGDRKIGNLEKLRSVNPSKGGTIGMIIGFILLVVSGLTISYFTNRLPFPRARTKWLPRAKS